MNDKVAFLDLEDDDKDLIVSFALEDSERGVRSLILLRTPCYEALIDEEERGVSVSLEGDYFDLGDFNMLNEIKIQANTIEIKSTFREYQLDSSNLQQSEIKDMLKLLTKQNFDNRFALQID